MSLARRTPPGRLARAGDPGDTPRSLRSWGIRRVGDRSLCRRVLAQLELVAAVRHVDGCRDCRLEIAQRTGLGWQIAGELARSEGRTAILGVPDGEPGVFLVDSEL